MKKLGFFGGSFNPPTYAHINVAKMSIEKFNLDAVYFVPVGNLYNKLSLIDENYRYIEYLYGTYFVATDDNGNLGVINSNGKEIIDIKC